jgi:hypothetical protein
MAEIQPGKLILAWMVDAEFIEIPVVEGRWSSYSMVQIEWVMPSSESHCPCVNRTWDKYTTCCRSCDGPRLDSVHDRSRMFILPEVMSILALRVLEPSGNSPARIRRKRSRFSSTVRLRYGLSLPGSVSVPRYCLISSKERSQTKALPFLIRISAYS